MDQIEVTIKIETKNLINYMIIGRSDKIEKLKEFCEKISDIPSTRQILIYKGKILSNDKLISDYNIDNGQTIILKKREETMDLNVPLDPYHNISNLNNIFSNKNKSLNKQINFNEFANIYNQIDYFSFLKEIDIDKIKNFFQLIGMENVAEFYCSELQKNKHILNKPEYKDIINNMLKDPSLLEIIFNNPEFKSLIINNPFLELSLKNPQYLTPQEIQKAKNLFKKDEKKMNESSFNEISEPPDPFGNSQMLNSSGKK